MMEISFEDIKIIVLGIIVPIILVTLFLKFYNILYTEQKETLVNFFLIIFWAFFLFILVSYLLNTFSDFDEEFITMSSFLGSFFISNIGFFYFKNKDYNKEIDIANNLFNSGKYIDALIAYSKITHVSTRRFVLHNSGLCLENLEYYEEAIMYYDDVISTNPSYIDVHFCKFNCLEKMKKYYDALLCIEKCIVLNDKNAESYYMKGRLLINLNRPKEAINFFEQGLALDNQNNDITFSIYFLLYSLYRDILMDDKAIELCDRAITHIPHRQIFYIYKASLLYNEGLDQNQMQLGFDTLLLGLKNNPIENKEIYDKIIAYRSGLLGNDNKFNKLYINYKNLFKEFPNNYYYALWGDTLYNLKEYEQALEKYYIVDRIQVDSSIHLSVLQQIINCFMNLGRFDEMLVKCDEGLVMYEGNNELLIFKMIALDALGKYNEVLILSELVDFSNNPQSLYVKFDCLYKLDRYQEVIDKIDVLNEQDIDVLNMKGLSYKHLKKYSESLKVFNDIIQKNDKSFTTYINKGGVFIKQKKYEKALVEFNYVISNIDVSEKNYGYLLGMAYLSCADVYILQDNNLDKVFDNLEKAIQYYNEVKQKIIDDKDFDSIRDDERYKKLVK